MKPHVAVLFGFPYIIWAPKGQRRQNEDRFIVDKIGPYYVYAVLDGHGGFECAETYSNLLIAMMNDHLPENLPDAEALNSASFWENLFSEGVSEVDKMIEGSSGKDFTISSKLLS